MEFEKKIPLALDPSGITISIEEAKKGYRYYRCIECHDYLQVRQGDIRTWYYAHYPQNKESPECSLRTDRGIEELIENLRTSPVEKSEKNHSLRIAIIPDFNTRLANVVALIQNPVLELNTSYSNADSILNSININGEGLLNGFDKRVFQTGRPVVRLKLNPSTTNYTLNCHSIPELEGFTGVWTSRGIHVGDKFVGEGGIFERLENYGKISESDLIFEIIDTKPESNTTTLFKIGTKFAIERKIGDIVNKNNKDNKGLDVALKSFEVDVIEPRSSHPWGDDVIYGTPNSQALLAIRPAEGLDPEFEIVTVPKRRDCITKIAREGKGKIRYQFIQFPSHGSYRITIHHLDSHAYFHFYASEENAEKLDTGMGKNLVKISYVNNEEKHETIYPWQNKTIYLKRSLLSRIKVLQTIELPIDIEVSKDNVYIPIKKSSTSVNIIECIDTLAEDGFSDFLLKFKAFGTMRIILSEAPQKMELKEIAEKILSLGINPQTRVSWDIIRKICEVPPGTLHKNLQEIITPKKVRKALKLLKNGGNFRV